eukprot:11631098-Karenia_brevis.AAC.1
MSESIDHYSSVSQTGGFSCFDAHGNEADVDDCFWNFCIDPIADYFGIQEAISGQELVDFGFHRPRKWDAHRGLQDIQTHEIVYPVLR